MAGRVPPIWEDPERFKAYSRSHRGDRYGQILRSSFGACATIAGGKQFVQKSTMIGLMLPDVLQLFPDASFIRVVRDGRAVALSWAKRQRVEIERYPEAFRLRNLEDDFDKLIWKCGRAWSTIVDATDRDLGWVDFDLWKHPDRFRVGEKPMTCPSCSISMVAIDYDDTEVEVDFCTSCRGVWLDGGELEKIIGSLTENLLTMEASDYARASLEEAKELITGREGAASEWRDLATVLRLLQYRILSGNPTLGRMLAEFQAKSPF